MRKTLILLVFAGLALPVRVAAQTGPAVASATLTPDAGRAAVPTLTWKQNFLPDFKTETVAARRLVTARQATQSTSGGRHPVLMGALIGAGAGAVSAQGRRWNELYCANGGDEDCLFHGAAGTWFGAGVGAGVGALIGFIAGR